MEPTLSDDDRQRLLAQYAEIAALAGGLAHEIKNPLSTIGMNLELMSEELDVEESPRDRRLVARIQTVQRECKNLENVLNDFLQFARAGELNLSSADLNQVVQQPVQARRLLGGVRHGAHPLRRRDEGS